MDMTPNLVLIAVQAVPFLLVLFVLDKVIFKPMLAYLDEREQSLVDGRARAADLQSEIETRLETYEQRLEEARGEIGELRAKRRLAAQEEYERRLSEARKKADDEVSEAVSGITQERQQAWAALEVSARQLAGEIAGRVLGRQSAVG